jgi:hypothetical protein
MKHTDNYIDVVRGHLRWRYRIADNIERFGFEVWSRSQLQGLVSFDNLPIESNCYEEDFDAIIDDSYPPTEPPRNSSGTSWTKLWL